MNRIALLSTMEGKMTEWDMDYFKETIPFIIFMFGVYLIIMSLVTTMYLVFRDDDVYYKTAAPVVDLTPAHVEKIKDLKFNELPMMKN